MRTLQGTVPVVFISFADLRGPSLTQAVAEMKQILRVATRAHEYLLSSNRVDAHDRAFLARISDDMDDVMATTCLKRLFAMLEAHWGTRPVILLDEYDTPLQEAWLGGYWDEMAGFVRSLFNSTFKTNPSLGRALITGVTRVSQGGTRPSSESQPERFCHGLVLGLLVGLLETHAVESTRGSGYGRYDIALVPKDGAKTDESAEVIEFKVFDPEEEATLADTVERAHEQIARKGYVAGLVERGFVEARIRTHGIAFEGKRALVG